MKTIQSWMRRDRGSVSLFHAVIAVALLAAAGLVVDGGARLTAVQRADEAANQAARVGANQASGGDLIEGRAVQIDPNAAATAARSYLDKAGIQGTVSVRQDTLVVDTSVTHQPIFLAGVGAKTVRGHAEVKLVAVQGGKQW